MTDRPSFLWPLRRPEISLEAAFADCVALFMEHPAPSHLCQQCFGPPWDQQIISAAREVRAGKAPDLAKYRQIYSEHPMCVGGVDTIKLFAPFGLRDLLAGGPPSEGSSISYCDVIEKMVQAGFWFWPEHQRAAMREIALCLFWEWFEEGRFAWPMPHYRAGDMLGPADEVLALCTLCLIDPFDIVRVLSALHTPQADAALAGPLNFSAGYCFYVAQDTSSGETVYQDATTAIAQTLAAREAAAFIAFVTQDWVDTAYFRNEQRAPDVAKELSDFGRYYDINMIETRLAAQAQSLDVWPALDLIE